MRVYKLNISAVCRNIQRNNAILFLLVGCHILVSRNSILCYFESIKVELVNSKRGNQTAHKKLKLIKGKLKMKGDPRKIYCWPHSIYKRSESKCSSEYLLLNLLITQADIILSIRTALQKNRMELDSFEALLVEWSWVFLLKSVGNFFLILHWGCSVLGAIIHLALKGPYQPCMLEWYMVFGTRVKMWENGSAFNWNIAAGAS